MAVSKAQIFNITLNILGVSMPLENANSDDNRAILLNNYYELAKNYVLKDFDWNFASTYRKLALVEDDFVYKKYKYCYDYPNDCIAAREITDDIKFQQYEFIISSLPSGASIILTDCQNAILRYTRNIEKEIYFSSEFSISLAYYLASLTSSVITGSIQKGEMAFNKYKVFLKRAKLLNAQEGTDIVVDDTTYIDARS